MTLNEYQQKAMTTCMPSSENFSYMFLNLVGEVGELASKVAKSIRKGQCSIGLERDLATQADYDGPFANDLWDFADGVEERRELIAKELGDCLWQLSGLCKVLGWDLEYIAQMNLDKLAARKAIGTIDGNGDGIERGK